MKREPIRVELRPVDLELLREVAADCELKPEAFITELVESELATRRAEERAVNRGADVRRNA